jgi:hypothetical protein
MIVQDDAPPITMCTLNRTMLAGLLDSVFSKALYYERVIPKLELPQL